MVRVKRRYITLKIKYQQGCPPQEVFVKELKDRVKQTYGDFGIACLSRGFSVKKYDQKDGFMVVCVRKGVHEMIMSVAPVITNIDRKQCSVTIFHLSGTMRSSLKKLKLDYITSLRASIAEKMPNAQSKIHSHVEVFIAKKDPIEKDEKNEQIKSEHIKSEHIKIEHIKSEPK